MKKKPHTDATDLRLRAEERLKEQKSDEQTPSSEADEQQLLHELQVQKMELEIQNEELMESLEHLRLALLASQDGIWDWDLSTDQVFFSPRYYTMAGYEVDEFPHRLEEFTKRIHPEDVDRVMAVAKEHLDGLIDRFIVEFRFRMKSGNWLWVQGKGTIVERDSKGRPLRFAGTHGDITERKQAEEELAASEKRFQAYLEQSPVCTKMVDPDYLLRYMSPAGIQALKIEHIEDYYGKPFPPDLYPEPSRTRMKQDLEAAKKTGKSIEQESLVLDLHGNEWWFQTLIRPINDDQGQLDYLLVVSVDITERKRAEEALRKSEEKRGRLFDTMSEGVFYQSADGTLTDVNAAALRMFGVSREEFLNRTSLHSEWDVIREDGTPLPGAEHPSMQVLSTGKSVHDLVVGIRKPQTQVYTWVSVSGIPEFHEGESTPYQVVVTIHDLTERKQAEEELWRSERLLQRIFDVLPIGLWFADKDGKLLRGNPAGVKIWGAEPHVAPANYGVFKARRLPSREEILPEDWALAHTIREGTTTENELIEIDAFDGQTKAILNSTVPVLDDQGAIQGAIIVNQDITELKQAEEAVAKSNDLLTSVIEQAPFAIHILEGDFNSISVVVENQESARIMGEVMKGRSDINADISETLTTRFFTIDGKQEIPLSRMPSPRAFQGEVVTNEEFLFRHADGTEVMVEASASPVYSANGQIRAITVVFHDITARKQAQLALTAEKERLSVTLRSIGDGVITTNTTGQIVMLNKAAEALTGWDSEDAVGRSLPEVFNIINEFTRQPCENPIKRVLAAGDIAELENHTCLIAKDGREIIIADSGAPIHDNESRIIGVILVFRDMTEKQKLDESMQRAQKLESLGVLAGGIAHDFNNLLGGIFGHIETALEETSEEAVSTCLAESLSNIDRARALTQQLLTFAKGGAPIKKVEHLFPFAQKTAQFALSGSSVSSKFHIPEDLWPCNFDKNQIGQVINNLALNAQQAMPNGGTIEVSARNISLATKEHISLAAGNYVKLSMKDQGIGIPKEFLPRIFDPYYTTKSKGHGLGLSSSYSIVNRHGGCIDIESEPGKGTTFHVYLPASIESISALAGKRARKHTGKGTFLVMDDEEALRDIMKRRLESFGYTVVLKDNGEAALDFFVTERKANRKLAGMIFDLTIPGGMGGEELIKEIRKTDSDTPAFVASGYSEDPIMAKPKKYGFTASICKPFMNAELSEMLNKHVNNRK